MRAIGAVAVVLWLLMSGCATTGVSQSPGRPTVYEDPGSPGRVQGVGIESQDIQSMADRMVRDMLANQYLAGRSTSPRVIIDAEYFRNESSQPINKNLITDKLRVDLNRAANGRMVFVGRNYANMVQEERELKREGVVTGGTGGTSPAPAGAD
jgi:PBP1b-binding outer membrane lipoprotein LpoB